GCWCEHHVDRRTSRLELYGNTRCSQRIRCTEPSGITWQAESRVRKSFERQLFGRTVNILYTHNVDIGIIQGNLTCLLFRFNPGSRSYSAVLFASGDQRKHQCYSHEKHYRISIKDTSVSCFYFFHIHQVLV